jgi:Ca2+-binding RTX toxin-like protein
MRGLRPVVLVAILVTGQLVAVAEAGRARYCDGERATIVGTRRTEIITGTRGPDVIVALGGNDTVFGKGGGDVICGNGGHDDLIPEGDTGLRQRAGADRLFGNEGNDRMRPGRHGDHVVGGPGDDVVNFDSAPGPLNINLAAGSATGEGTDVLRGIEDVESGMHDDDITGSAGDNRLMGNEGNDEIDGGSGDDFLEGSSGDDLLDGADGSDSADGGDGIDTCVNVETDTNCEAP